MIFAYDFDRLSIVLKTILQRNLPDEGWRWLENESSATQSSGGISKFNIAFVAMPRKTGKSVIEITSKEAEEINVARAGLIVKGWTCDRLSRVWLLMMLNHEQEERYVATVENLFLSAEMSELVALYSALPVLAYPERWRKRCAEGIRNNIGQVLEAVICNNPYPSEELDEAAWNQLVLKAIFTEKPVLEIIGLRERSNKALVESLSDYAHERWAAHRDVNPLLWICVSPFVDQRIFSDIQRLFSSGDERAQEAAALVCHETSYEPAKQLLAKVPALQKAVAEGAVTWEGIAGKIQVSA